VFILLHAGKFCQRRANQNRGKNKTYLSKINVHAGEALEAGEVLYMTSLYDMEELRRFERGAEKMKKEMRSKK
jgi:hypothetical protein